jgi:hypothetical protein
LIARCAKRCHHDLFDRNPLQVRQLLPKSVTLCRYSANDAVGSTQLLHHHVEMTVQGAQRRIVVRAA